MSFDTCLFGAIIVSAVFQSLWNRAMSFDFVQWQLVFQFQCLNPFETGQCLSTFLKFIVLIVLRVSIPLEQGNVFRHYCCYWFCFYYCLNPFGTGQCLSTDRKMTTYNEKLTSQSLWNRAMSFDKHYSYMLKSIKTSQSLWNRAMSFDFSSYSNYSIYWVSIPLEQGNVFRLLLTLVLLS